jgi:hypothetical protein
MRAGGILASLLVALLAGACAGTPRLNAQVESFSTIATSPVPAEVAIVPFGGIDPESLEFRRYSERLAANLERRGFAVVPAAAEPPWRMRLGYRVDEGRQITETIGTPYDPYRRYPNLRTYDPLFHDPFRYDRTEVVTYTVYGRHVVLVLVDARTGEEVWRASVFNVGRRRALVDVFDAMVDAAFVDFPAEGARRVTVKVEPPA